MQPTVIAPRAAPTTEKDQPQMSMDQDGKPVLGFSLGVGREWTGETGSHMW